MKSYLTTTVVLGSLLMAPVALAQGEQPAPQGDEAKQAQPVQNPKALIGKTLPSARLKATDASHRTVGEEVDMIQVLYVFDVASDLETNWYEPWQGKNEAVLPTLEHLQAIYLEAYAPEEQSGEASDSDLLIFALAAETFPGATYGAQPGGDDAGADTKTDAATKAEKRMQRIQEIRAQATATFPFLDAEPSRVTADLDLEENVVLIVDTEGKIQFAAREGDLKDDAQDFLQVALLQIRNGESVTHPCGKPMPVEEE